MTIRYRLLLSYLFISLTSSILITLMVFHHFSTELTNDIKTNLKLEAASMIQEIDWHLFERIQNIMIWKNLEVMQDIQIHDVDKRLAYFLRKISKGYQGMYPFLLALDKQQHIIASSQMSYKLSPDIDNTPWHKINIDAQSIYLQTGSAKEPFFALRVTIPDQFGQDDLGSLYTAIDADIIYRILEAPLSFQKDSPQAYALLLDQNNQVIAASSALRQADLLFNPLPAAWNLTLTDTGTGIQQINTAFLKADTWLVSWASSTGHRSYHGLGWKVLLMTPQQNALEPVLEMWQILALFIALTTLLAAAVALWTSQHIASPIVKLAKFTQNFAKNKTSPPPIINEGGEIAQLNKQFTLMIADLEKSQQNQVRMAKFAVIAEMAATMAHEIRTPLGILKSSAQILAREKNLSPIAEEMLGFIGSETARLNELVTTLLESSRPREPQFLKRSLVQVIEHAIDLLTVQLEHKQVRILLDKSCAQDQLSYDWDQMLQVFLNLINNAIQHIEIYGLISIHLEAKPDYLSIQVSDDGKGVTDSQKKSIFEPFFTKRQEGIGLGLTVVQQMIDTHQGTISITDSQWGGACFTIQLPWHKETI